MPFNWKNSPGLPQPPQPIIIPPTAITYKVDQVANTVNWGGTLLYNTAPAVYDVIYPSNGSYVFIDTSNLATMEYVNNAIANVNVGGGGIVGNTFVTISPTNRFIANQANVVADSNTDVLTVYGGRGVIVTTNASNDMVEISSVMSTAIYPSENSLLVAANTWTKTTIPFANDTGATHIIWSSGIRKYVAVKPSSVSLIITSEDGINWNAENTPTIASSKRGGAIAYAPELGKYVVLLVDTIVNQQSQALISVDAKTWSLINVAGNSANQIWTDITWSPSLGLFAACAQAWLGTNNQLFMSSTDGINWTLRTAPQTQNWNGICWSDAQNKFVSVGGPGDPSFMSNTKSAYSSDGITWTGSITPNTLMFGTTNPGYWFDVTYASGLGLYVAVGGSQGASYTYPTWTQNLQQWMTSADGINWSIIEYVEISGFPGNNYVALTQICWSPELARLVATGSSGLQPNYAGGNTNNFTLAYSTDAVNWVWPHEPVANALASGMNQWWEPAWSPTLGMFVVVGSTAASRNDMLYSTTGTSWTLNTPVLETLSILDVAWAPEKNLWVAVGTNYGSSTNNPRSIIQSAISSEGKSWTIYKNSTSSPYSVSWNSVCWSPELELFVTVGDGGGIGFGNTFAATSSNGKVWTLHDTPLDYLNAGLSGVVWCKELGIFVAVNFYRGLEGKQALTSSDGVTWTVQATPTQMNDFFWWGGIAYSPELGRIVAVAQEDSLTQSIMSSTDGITWTPHPFNQVNYWIDIAWSPDLRLFAATGFDANTFYPAIATSEDGINWKYVNTPNIAYWYGITWSHEYQAFMAIGGDNVVVVSTDGIHWNTVYTGLSAYTSYETIKWSPELGIWLAASGLDILYSNTAGIWRTINSLTWDISSVSRGVLPLKYGGTGISRPATTNGQVLIGNTISSTFDLRTLTAGSGVTITNGPGTITISSTGGGGGSSSNSFVTINVAGQSNVVADSNADTLIFAIGPGIAITTNAVTDTITWQAAVNNTYPILVDQSTINISHASSGVTATTYGNANHVSQITVDTKGHVTSASNVKIAIDATQITSGTLSVSRGGTGNTLTPANGAIPIGNTVSGGYDINTLTQGTGIVITNDKGSITIAATGGAATDQFARDHANGAFDKANGAIYTAAQIRANISNSYPIYYNQSTGVVSFVPATANGQLLIGNTVSGTFDVATLTQGTGGITITNDKGAITISSPTLMPTGGGSDRVFYENDQNVTANYTVTVGRSAISAGPITLSPNVVVTLPPGSRWVIV